MKVIKIISVIFFSKIALASYGEDEKTRVAILLFDDVQIIDFSAPWEVFGQAGFEVMTVSETGETVTTVMGMSVNPKYSFKTLPEYDVLLVPGGSVRETANNKVVTQWIVNQQDKVDHTLSVCTGSYILAESGILNGQTATTYHGALKDFSRNYPQIDVVRDKRYTDNGKVLTSAGLSSGIDAALHLVAKINGLDDAKRVAMRIEYDWDPNQGFVRGLMADRHYPTLEIDFPENTQFRRIYNFGDTEKWKAKFKVSTSGSISEIYELFKDGMKNFENWESLNSGKEETLIWSYKESDESVWQLSLTTSDKKSGKEAVLDWSITKI